MPTTRSKQATLEDVGVATGQKREADDTKEETADSVADDSAEPPAKKAKTDPEPDAGKVAPDGDTDYTPKAGILERGHVYFFYRPKVELEAAHDIDEVQRFLILLVPRPPAFAASSTDSDATKPEPYAETDMAVLQDGADAVPASAKMGEPTKRFRLISVGKKQLPHADQPGQGGRKQTLWATVSTVGNDLHKLEEGLASKEYETKTRGPYSSRSASVSNRS
jgi:hypothetical protein